MLNPAFTICLRYPFINVVEGSAKSPVSLLYSPYGNAFWLTYW